MRSARSAIVSGLDLIESGEPIDIVTVSVLLDRAGQLQGSAGQHQLAGLMGLVATVEPDHVEHHAQVLHQLAEERRRRAVG